MAGNLLAAFRSKSTTEVRGVLRVLPVSGALWVMGTFAITGSPPFGPFLSEFTILRAAVDQGRGFVAGSYLALLALTFLGMATVMLRMAQGAPPPGTLAPRAEPLLAVAPPALLGALTLLLGVWVPPALDVLLREAARTLGGP